MYCIISDCSNVIVARDLCAKHYKRLQRHGSIKSTRPDDWGQKEKHPLYNSWGWHKKKINGIADEWRLDFWQFVNDIGERPSNLHKLFKINQDLPLNPDNFEWIETKEGCSTKAEYARKWRKKNPDKDKNIYLKKQFGISLDAYNEMLENQNGVCKICNQKDNVALAVDHCHTTGKIRGLLCSNCNRALGLFKDSIENLISAINYLEK